MGRILIALVKTVLFAVIATGTVIASFYFAYFILILIVLGGFSSIAWFIFNREEVINWFEYEDYD